MARVLIGWELGANRGHVRIIAPIVDALTTAGHSVAVAGQQVDRLHAEFRTAAIFQAPVWPGLLSSRSTAGPARTSTMTDILARLRLGEAGVLGGLIAAWDTLIALWKPDMAVAEFAPALLLAARGRVRSVAIGTGFTTPPGDVDAMMRFDGEPAFEESAMLDTIDDELRGCGRGPLDALPQLFAADHAFPATFRELDPYRDIRRDAYCRPEVPRGEKGAGNDVFVYAFARSMDLLIRALPKVGLPVRAYLPDASPATIAGLRSGGVIVETRPVDWGDIARTATLAVSHGGHGFSAGALLTGMPHLVAAYDLEKALTGRAIEQMGMGRAVALPAQTPDALAAVIRETAHDATLAERAYAGRMRFRERSDPSATDRVMALLQE